MSRLRALAAHLAECGWIESWPFVVAAWAALLALTLGGAL